MFTKTPKTYKIGETYKIMMVGHEVMAKLVRVELDPRVWEDMLVWEFVCHADSGSKRLCLDLGQSWYISEGQEYKVLKFSNENVIQ